MILVCQGSWLRASRRPGFRRRVRGLRPFCGRGWRAVDEDGEPGLRKRRRSSWCGQVPQPGEDLGKQAVAGREPQDQVAVRRRGPPGRPTCCACRWRRMSSRTASGPGPCRAARCAGPEEILNPKVNWRKVLAAELRRAVAEVSGAVDYSYRRPSRRAAVAGNVVLPALRRWCPTSRWSATPRAA